MLIKPFFHEPARHLYKLTSDADYRSWCIQDAKLSKIERFKECKTRIRGWDIVLPDAASFLSAYKEIFVSKIYQFRASSKYPNILDLGANIGLSILFFKTIYPFAKIAAFEADPKIFEYLKHNIHGNGFTDVELINKAAWNANTVLKFHAEGADGGRVVDSEDDKLIEIEAIDIREFVQERQFEFLKIDIEGAEEKVFPALREQLASFRYIFLEYHSKPNQKQQLGELLQLMTENGFRVDIHNVMIGNQPLTKQKSITDFDLQLNIFAWKAT